MTEDASAPKDLALIPTAKILKCFSGACVAGTIALLAYRLVGSIAATFAAKPILSDNPAVVNIASAVRTLVVGMVALGAGVFGFAALGLLLLGIQLGLQRLTQRPAS
ncbi:MAG TPA: DUF3082 domain-containing protein [Leptolyngbyaceae cyanobacterium M65_K2018_010]|nr:DUF3082 domain-containing protein [Leptolyngbyaceae cyanobacterium M65_K2018_010]